MTALAIKVVDYLPMKFYCGDSRYLYGNKSQAPGKVLFRQDSLTSEPEKAFDFGAEFTAVQGVWTTSVPGELFAQAYNISDNKFCLFRSIDYGSNFGSDAQAKNKQPVFLVGDTDGTKPNQISNVFILGRGFCELNGALYFGEYNVNQQRVKGAKNDQVRIMKSADRGLTWTPAITWNTDGSTTNIRHVHGCQTDGSHIYISTGDLSAECGIIKWDGVSQIPANQNLNKFTTCKHGSQRYRTGDLLFPAGEYLYYMVDSHTPEENRGVFKLHKSMTQESVRVNQQITNFAFHSGWYGVKLPNQEMIFSEFLEAGHTDSKMRFYSTRDGGETWDIVGTFAGLQGITGGGEFFRWEKDNKLYYSRRGTGKDYHTCTVLDVDGEYSETTPPILHPVYWVAPNGTDSGSSGWRPSTPFRTPGYALKGKIVPGSRLLVAEGTYNEGNATTATFNTSAVQPGIAGELTVVEGAGREQTIMNLPDSATAAPLLTINKTVRPLKFRKIQLRSEKNGVSNNTITNNADAGNPVPGLFFEDAIVGSETTEQAQVIDNSHIVVGDRLIVKTAPGKGSCVRCRANSKTKIANALFVGGSSSVNSTNADADIELDHIVAKGYTSSSLRTLTGATKPIKVKNSAFIEKTVSAYHDGANLTETDETCDYNFYAGALSNIANNGGSHSITGGDPGFVNADGGDYNLSPASILISKGVQTETIYDAKRAGYGNPPSIGMFEAAGVSPSPPPQPPQPPVPSNFSAWTSFSGSMPPLAFAPSAPAKLKEVQVWDKIVGKDEIDGVPQ